MTGNEHLLSIAIPVYNFAEFLPDTLDSLLEEAKAQEVEVLIFDGCSTDNTQEIAGSYRLDYPNLRYVKALAKGGIDVDMARSLAMTGSDYCWLFSGDDICQPGSIQYLVDVIKNHRPDLILGRHNECKLDMQVLKAWPVLNTTEDTVFNLEDPNQRAQYFSLAESSEAFFSFMSCLIVNRATWFQRGLNPDNNIRNWAHIARLWSLTDGPFKLYYSDRILLNRRGENDSFSKDGMLNRFKLQVAGLQAAVNASGIREEAIRDNLKRVIRKEVYPHWLNAVRTNLQEIKAPRSCFDELDQLLASIDLRE